MFETDTILAAVIGCTRCYCCWFFSISVEFFSVTRQDKYELNMNGIVQRAVWQKI